MPKNDVICNFVFSVMSLFTEMVLRTLCTHLVRTDHFTCNQCEYACKEISY